MNNLSCTCEVHCSNPIYEEVEGRIIVYKKIVGYIRAFDKPVTLGRQIVTTMSKEEFKAHQEAMQNRMQAIWREVEL